MMVVDRIETIEEFERVRDAYERAYTRDPYRTVFVSWPWLRSYFASMAPQWLVLAARRDDTYSAFAVVVVHEARLGPIVLHREAALGAYPTADYASLVIAEAEDEAIAAFAREIARVNWDTFRACNIRDPRVGRLVALCGRGNSVREEPQNRCLFLPLPSSWEEFVNRPRHGNQKLRRILKGRGPWRNGNMIEADDSTVDADIELLLRMHHARWNSNLGKHRSTFGRLFHESYVRGCCRIFVLRDAERQPVAALAGFVEPEGRSWGSYRSGYDRMASKDSPGIAIHAMAIERAISEGYEEFDFLRGEEMYKTGFGTETRLLDNFVVRRTTLRSCIGESIWHVALQVKASLRRALLGNPRPSR